MIKFFRHICESLLMENKTAKALYAENTKILKLIDEEFKYRY